MKPSQQPGFPWLGLTVAVVSFSLICLGFSSKAHGAEPKPEEHWRGVSRVCLAKGEYSECRNFVTSQTFPSRTGCETYQTTAARKLIAQADEAGIGVGIITFCVEVDADGNPIKKTPT